MKNDMFIPDGNTIEDFKQRAKVIRNFYRLWKLKHPDLKVYNHSLKADINIRNISITETSNKAAKNYLSTLAVLQLDVILMAANYCHQCISIKKGADICQLPYICPGNAWQ